MTGQSSGGDPAVNSKGKSSFTSDVVTLTAGSVFAQALIVLASPVLTRLYDPEDFGLYALFLSLTGILTIVACLRYELAIMLPKRDEEAANLLGLSLILVATTSALMVPVIWILRAPLLGLFNAPGLEPYLWLVPISVFLGGVFSALNYWNSRTKHFKRLSVARVTSSVTSTGTQMGAGLAGYATGGSLIGAGILGMVVSTLVLGGQICRDDHRVFRNSINAKGMKWGLRRHRKFPIFDSWTALMNSISIQLPIFLLSAYFSPAVVGYYALSYRVLHLPINIIGSAVAQVFFQRATVTNFEGDLHDLVENLFIRLIIVGMLPFLMIFLVGEDIFTVFFGTSWAEAGVYAQIMSLWLFFVFITSPLSTLFAVFEKQSTFLLINILLLVVRVATLTFGGMTGSARLALIFYTIGSIIIWIYTIFWILNRSGVPFLQIIRNTAAYLLCCISIICLIIIAKYVTHIGPSGVVILSILGSLIYYSYIITKDDLLKSYVCGFLGRTNLK